MNQTLFNHYCKLHEIKDWRSLPKNKLGELVFCDVPQFWNARAAYLGTNEPDELIRQSPVEGRYTLHEMPGYRRPNVTM